MSSLGGVTLSQRGMLPVSEPVKNTPNTAPANKDSALDEDTTAPVEGVRVAISGAAMKAAGAQESQNSDIDDSGLPDQIQKTLKLIREIKKQIAEKQAQLQQVMTNSNLSPDQVRAQAAGLQAQIAGLTASLINAMASLAKSMKDLGAEDALKAVALMAK